MGKIISLPAPLPAAFPTLHHEQDRLGITMAWQEPLRFEGILVAHYRTLRNKELDPALYLDMVGLPPIVRRTNPLTKVTGGRHQRVDKRQRETLMAHGLIPAEAVDVFVKGILR
ncbi:MAG: hypothetical protein AB1461_10830 [Thermodesulfobacteriota bacterium]